MAYEHGERAARMPEWMRRPIAREGSYATVKDLLARHRLHTVCQSAKCPNQGECFASGTATFLVAGAVCTRGCRFCAVEPGSPEPLDPTEPERVAQAAAELGLEHVVVTMVTRDDLPDGAAGHVAAVIRAIRSAVPGAAVEVLTSDFGGSAEALDVVLAQRPDVFNHNVETVPRLYAAVRPQADYERSLWVLRRAADAGGFPVKSGLMLGLGESFDEVVAVLSDLRRAGCSIVTVGQYLRPSRGHLPVVEFVRPEVFAAVEAEARAMGFAAVASGPFVRSSYHAREAATAARA
ncbi:lipoyl synthase [Coriobacteriia bacterium Es71-Z0120]|uniref:lipoyl synthase n=1 Tax=Parvivirga hydrogeniphila TaxID=2939460 RepID=UPI002260D62C|nr:lipoyl synthase [Parvivirga hydrogeniphila]MCL4078636.1 lipoyl synthase [Parvivirga hydrogeniphila]